MNGRLPPVDIADSLTLGTSSLPLPMPCLGVVMPVFNEAATVVEILWRVLAQPCVQEVVIVDDGSTDGTSAILADWPARDPRVEFVSHAVNRGKGAAIRTGLALISTPLVIIQDADLEYDPQDFARIIQPLRNREAFVVYGSRYLEMAEGKKIRWVDGLSAMRTLWKWRHWSNPVNGIGTMRSGQTAAMDSITLR